MKRLILLAAAASLALFPIAAFAQSQLAATPRWVWETVNFRNAAAVNVNSSGFLRDSVSASGSATRSDTTAAMDLNRCYIPQLNGTATSDSVSFATVAVVPRAATGDPVASDDTLYLTTQVSYDGTNWVAMTPTSVFLAAGLPLGATGSTNECVVLKTTGTSAFTHLYKQAYTVGTFANMAQGGGVPTDAQWVGFRYVRFILGWGATCTGNFFVQFGHWQLVP